MKRTNLPRRRYVEIRIEKLTDIGKTLLFTGAIPREVCSLLKSEEKTKLAEKALWRNPLKAESDFSSGGGMSCGPLLRLTFQQTTDTRRDYTSAFLKKREEAIVRSFE
jgi:hypothetical protein